MGENPVENKVYAANQNSLYLKLSIGLILMIFLLKNIVKNIFLNGKSYFTLEWMHLVQ